MDGGAVAERPAGRAERQLPRQVVCLLARQNERVREAVERDDERRPDGAATGVNSLLHANPRDGPVAEEIGG